MKMELQFLVASIVCMGLKYVRSNNKMNLDQSAVHGNIYNLFDSIGKNDVEKIETYRKILEVGTMEEQQIFNAMKDELQFARKRNANKQEYYNLYHTNVDTSGKAATKFKRKVLENHDRRVDFTTTMNPTDESRYFVSNFSDKAVQALFETEFVSFDVDSDFVYAPSYASTAQNVDFSTLMKNPCKLGSTNDLKALKSLLEEAKYEPDSDFVRLLTVVAAQEGHLDIIRYMMQKKPPILNRATCTEIIFAAAHNGHLNVIQYMVGEDSSLLDEHEDDRGKKSTLAKIAADEGHKDILLYMLDKRPDSLLENNLYGENALVSAANKGILDVKILELLKRKSSLSARPLITRDRRLICARAAETGNLDVVKYFIEQDSSHQLQFQSSIGQGAATFGQCNVFWYMVEKNPSFLIKRDRGEHPLLQAVQNNCVRATKLESLVQKYHIPLGETDDMGENIAHKAARSNSVDIIAYIEEKEPSILNKESVDPYYSNTVASLAAVKGHWGVVQYLAKKNSSVYTEMTRGLRTMAQPSKSIFYLCVEKNLLDEKTFKWLLEEEKVPLNLRETVNNRNLAQLAMENENSLIFKYLVRNELSLLYQRVNESKTGPTVAHLAVQRGYFDLSKIIFVVVEKIPSIFAEKDDSNNGRSVLHLAIEKGCIIGTRTLEKLLDGKHVSLSETNGNGDTIAHAAAAAPDHSNENNQCYPNAATIVQRRVNNEASWLVAAEQEEAHLITYIARQQASLLAQKNHDGDTAAHIAAKKGHVFTLKAMAKVSSPTVFRTIDRQRNSVLHLLAATVKPRKPPLHYFKMVMLSYFKMVVEKGVPVMGINWQGETAAHIAARNGLLDVVEYMVTKEPAILRIKNMAGRTIAFTAAENAHYHIIECITDKDLLLEKDYLGNTIFHLIMESNSMNEGDFNNTFRNIPIPVDLLVTPNNHGMSAIHLAAQVGCVWIIEKVAAQNPRILVEKDHNGQSALSYAVSYQQVSVVMKILAKNRKFETQNIQALFQCPNEKMLLTIILKIEENIGKMLEWNQRHFDGIAIHSAIEAGYWNVLKRFLEVRGVDVNQPNGKGEPPIFTAARFKHLDMLRYLIEQQGADLLITDNDGNNILFVAMENDDLSTIIYVLDERKAPIDVNWRNIVGDSILHTAIRHWVSRGRGKSKKGYKKIANNAVQVVTKIARYLIEEKRANVNLPSQQNKTVFAIAAEHGRYDICTYLRDRGANDPHVKNKMGKEI